MGVVRPTKDADASLAPPAAGQYEVFLSLVQPRGSGAHGAAVYTDRTTITVPDDGDVEPIEINVTQAQLDDVLRRIGGRGD